MGAKRPLNGVRKCDGQTNRQTDIQTFRLIERIGPEGRFFEKGHQRKKNTWEKPKSRKRKHREKEVTKEKKTPGKRRNQRKEDP